MPASQLERISLSPLCESQLLFSKWQNVDAALVLNLISVRIYQLLSLRLYKSHFLNLFCFAIVVKKWITSSTSKSVLSTH